MWSNKEADFFPEMNKSFTFPGMGLKRKHTHKKKAGGKAALLRLYYTFMNNTSTF